MDMDWDAVGAMAELLGAVGVILSMIYLATQIRQNTLSNRIAAKQNTTNQFVRFTEQLLQNPRLSDVYMRGRAGLDQLNDEERVANHYLNRQLAWYYSAQWYQHEQGAIDDDDWFESWHLITNSWINQPGVQAWWAENAGSTNPGFRKLIDSAVAALVENKP